MTVCLKLQFEAAPGTEAVELARILLGLHLNASAILAEHYREIETLGGQYIGEVEVSTIEDET